MKHIFIAAFLSVTAFHSVAQQYTYTADLVNVKDDRVKVTCLVPKQAGPKAEFIFPNVIPGSYSVKEYGRYIDDFAAFDAQGNELKVKKADKYNFSIENAASLAKVVYFVNDSWEEKSSKRFIFQPGGTNIEKEKNFVINHYGFFGYIEGSKNLPYEITFLKPASLKGYSYLPIEPKDSTTDVLRAQGYDLLADNPVMYCKPDDATFKVGHATIDICVYAETGKVDAALMAEVVKPLAHALESFFDTLPVDRYVFMFYLVDPDNVPESRGDRVSSGFGALEHNRCSFYFMPETSGLKANKEMFQDACSHEFLHILTPLNLHSEEVADFNFRIPVMSKHLWMYEGVTEYFANLILLRDSLTTEKDFMKEIRRKIKQSAEFDLFSMTEMSKNVVEPVNQKRYLCVYNRGAILAMMLDLLIIDRSDGMNSLQEVMMKLTEKYGASRPFKDDDLIGEIVAITHPDVKVYFDRYITGRMTPDYSEYLEMIGYNYFQEYEKELYYFGPLRLYYNEERELFSFYNVGENLLGIKEADVFLSINSVDISLGNIDELYEKYFTDNESGDAVTLTVLRDGQVKTLIGKPAKATMRAAHYIAPIALPSQRAMNNYRKFAGRDFKN